MNLGCVERVRTQGTQNKKQILNVRKKFGAKIAKF